MTISIRIDSPQWPLPVCCESWAEAFDVLRTFSDACPFLLTSYPESNEVCVYVLNPPLSDELAVIEGAC